MNSNNTTNTWVIGCKRLHLPKCQSTNDEAAALARNDFPEGTVVSTDSQEAGRGQRGSSWQSETGANIMATVILRPTFLLAREQFRISIAVALSVFQTVKHYCESEIVKIKWPNDIYINGKKVAGILIENTLRQHQIGVSLAGIGLNVNSYPSEIITSTSLSQVLGKVLDRDEVMDSLISNFDAYYLRLRSGQGAVLLQEYYAALLGYQEMCEYTITQTNERITGTIKGIDEGGKLKLQVQNELQYFDNKEVAMVL